MQHTHRLAYLAGHMLIDLPEGRFVVDTGSAASFGDAGTATYGGRSHPLPREAGGIGLRHLAGLGLEARIGARLRGLLGMDLVGSEPVLWDGPRGRAVVRPAAPAEAVPCVPYTVSAELGVPIVSGAVGDRAFRLIFDTGAQFGYLPEREDLALGAEADDIADHHPVLGAIRSASVKAAVRLATRGGPGVALRERFGVHEPLSAGVLRPLAAGGTPVAILGCSWMPSRRVWLLPAERALAVE